MVGDQVAVVGEHGALVVQHPAQEPPVPVIPEGQVGQQIDGGGHGHEEDQAESDGPPGISAEAPEDMGMGDAPALPLRVSLGVEILPVSAVQRGKEEQPQPGPGVNARPFACDAQPHADPAGPQGEPGLL